MIDDFEDWTLAANGKQLLLSGGLSAQGLHRIGMLIEQPIHDDFVGTDSSESSGAAPPEVNMATRSQQYFGDIQHLSESLRKKDLNNLATYAKWFDRYAREIDQLSVLGVDPALLQYGAFMGNSFRDIANSLRGSDLTRTKSVAEQNNMGFSTYSDGNYTNYERYGRYGAYSRSAYQRNKIIASNLGTQAGENEAKAIVSQVESETAKVRQAMSQKYNVNFE